MATDLEKLVVQLSADIKGFDRQLAKAVGVSNKQFNAVERRARQMNKNLDGIFAKSFRGLTGPLAGIGAALGVNELRKMTDTWTDMNSRVALAAGGLDKGSEVMGRLGEMARRTYSDLEQTAESYLANSTALQELGYSTDQSLDYTEALNNALVISAAKGQRAATVTDALAKAMALGKLSGDNLNTVISQGGRVAEALAAGLGTTVGGLRKLGAQGKITGTDIVRSLSSQMEILRKEAEAMPATIGDGMQLLQNAMLEYVGNADQATGVSAKISEALVIMADNFDKTADVALQLAGVIAGALIGRSLLKMISTLGLAGSALISFTRALSAARTMAGLATAFTGLSAAAGPVGMLIGGAVVTSLMLYSSATAEASEGAKRFADRLNDIESRAEKSAEKVEAAGQRYNEALKNALGHESKAAESEFTAAHEAVVKLLDSAIEMAPALKIVRDEAGNLSRQPMATQDQMNDLGRLRDALSKNAHGAVEAKNEIYALANANPNFQALAAQLSPLLDRLALVAQGFRDVRAEVAATSDEGQGSSSFNRGGRTRARQKVIEERQVNDEYVSGAKQRASLGKAQYDLETKIAQVRAQAEKDGRKLTEAQIKEIAQAQLAGDASRSAEGKKPKKERDNDYERLTKSITDRTAALLAETSAQAGVNPLVKDYGRTVTEAAMAHDILAAAKKAGMKGAGEFKDATQVLNGDLSTMSPAARELAENIRKLASAYADADVEAQKLAEAQDKIRQNAEEMADFQKDLAKGMVDGFVNGASAAEMFANALGKVADKLIEIGMNSIFDTDKGGFNIFGALGGMFGGGGDAWSGLRLANGGHVSGAGTSTSDSIPARLSNGEFVVNAKATRQHRAMLEAINSGRDVISRAGGGIVSSNAISAPRMPIIRPPSQSQQQGAGVHVTLGWSKGADGNIAPIIESVSQQTFKQGIKQYDKGSAVRTSADLRQVNQRGYGR